MYVCVSIIIVNLKKKHDTEIFHAKKSHARFACACHRENSGNARRSHTHAICITARILYKNTYTCEYIQIYIYTSIHMYYVSKYTYIRVYIIYISEIYDEQNQWK